MKKLRNISLNLICLSSLLFFFLFLLPINVNAKEELLKAMKLAAKNEYLELYINEENTSVAVKVLKSGDIWFTNPTDIEEDAIATPYNKDLLRSQFSVRYYNKSVQANEMDNYNDSIKEGQFEITLIDNGVKIVYTLGEAESKIVLPIVISEERYLQYYNQMDEKAQRQVKRNYSFLDKEAMDETTKKGYLELYPSFEDTNLYIIKSGTQDFKREELMGYFAAVGYTAEDMNQDMIDNGYESDNNKPYFIVPMTYLLDKDNLVVSIKPEEIQYNTDDFYLIDVDVLENFGAAGMKEEGYIFVPDGSGALIYLNNNKTSNQPYTSAVYGRDKTVGMLDMKKAEGAENLSIKMPVFGIKAGDKALFAIIEDGEGFADISADIAGRSNSYNSVYAGFTYLQNGAISLGSMVGSRNFQMYAPKPYDGEYKIRYGFLTGEKATYSGMAMYYRDYLAEREKLIKHETKEDIPFYVEFVGAINKSKSFLGIKYQSIEALTTYKQAMEIVEELKKNQIDNIKVRYTGWANGGLGNQAFTKITPVGKLNKGGTNLSQFLKAMKDSDVPVYLDGEFQYVYKDTAFDSFSTSKYSPRYFDNSTVKGAKYLIPNGFVWERTIGLISPYYVKNLAETFIKRGQGFQADHVSVGSLASDVFSDFLLKQYADRQGAVKFNEEAIKTLSNSFGGVMGSNGNAYSFAHVSDMVHVPMDSNRYFIIDETIPFYQMVVRGYIEFAGKPFNLSEDYKDSILKAVETGSGLYFKWIYKENSAVKETEYNGLYSVYYKFWLEEAVNSYKEVNEVLGQLQGQTIVDHIQVAKKLYQVTYEDGTKILVNYNSNEAVYEGSTVNGKDFKIVKEGR